MAAGSLVALSQVERLSSRVIRILGLNPGPFTLQGTNTYIVGTGNKRILIDTGNPDKPDYVKLLNETLSDLKASIEHVLITHWHLDHIGGVQGVCQSFHPDIPIISKFPRQSQSDTFLAYPYNYLRDGDEVHTEGCTLKVIATPGHTDDHIALYLEEEKSLFSGDCILGQGTAVFEDLKSYMESLEKLKSCKPRVMYPGHGPVISDAAGTIDHYIAHRLAREKQILDVLKKSDTPVTAMEIVKMVYKDIPEELWKAAENNVILHLGKLVKENRIHAKATGAKNDITTWILIDKSHL